MRDHYKILGVPRDANRHAIQVAYRRLARRHHPDFGGDPKIMVVLNEAWAVLGDPARRELYDGTRSRTSARQPIVAPEAAGPLAAAAERRRPYPSEGRRETTLDFGRYQGWTLRAVAAEDHYYLEWLMRSQAGRMYRPEITALLDERRTMQPPTAVKERPRRSGSRFRR